MHFARSTRSKWLILALTLFVSTAYAALARAQNTGFQVPRYEPTPAGEWSFLVDHPWYSSTRYFAGGFTLDYGHNPLVLGRRGSSGGFDQIDSILSHQLLGHFDFAGSFLDRVNLAFSLPIILLERGQPLGGVTPTDGASVGDPRLSGTVRLYGQPDRTPFSLGLGVAIWIPLRAFSTTLPAQSSDETARFEPKLILGGLAHRFRWSFTFAFLYRADAVLGQSTEVGSEIQLGFAGSYADVARRLAIGPELLLSTIVTNGNAFQRDYTSLEFLIGAHYNILGQVQVGAALGLGLLHEPGTPDVRFLLRIAYAPIRGVKLGADRDGDGILDRDDACPSERGVYFSDRKLNGCPPLGDRDSDGVPDAQDLCPRVPRGNFPDPARPGCPSGDRDGDGVPDINDRCPETPVGDKPDPARLGCPLGDQDGDGVSDRDDICPQVPKGEHPDMARPGCPIADTDHDGVPDSEDECVDVPAGPTPDSDRAGCPAPGSAPAASGNAASLARLLVIFKPIFFAHRQAKLERRSIPILRAIAAVLKSEPAIARLLVRGHTDSEGDEAYDDELSKQRADVVAQWLIDHGIEATRLDTRGFSATIPYRANQSPSERFRNRRADFRISDPPISEADMQAAEDKDADKDSDEEDTAAVKSKGHKSKKKGRNKFDEMLDAVDKGKPLPE